MVDFVFNIHRTSSRKCRCAYPNTGRTWLKHWARVGGRPIPAKCQIKRCPRAATVGAHVREEDDLRQVWILPTCQYHNKRRVTVPMELKPTAYLVGGSMKRDCT